MPRANAANKASDAALFTLQKLGKTSKLRAAKVGDKTLKAIGKKEDDALIASSQAFKSTVDALAKVHQWNEAPQNQTLVNINLSNLQFPDSKEP